METWKIIPGFSRYEASNTGKIKIKRYDKIILGYITRYGYVEHNIINDDDKGVKITAHNLICITFYGDKPDMSYTVDHINRVKTDNTVENLRWASKSDQIKNQVRKNTICRNIEMVDKNTEKIIETFKCIDDASKKTKLHSQTICKWINSGDKNKTIKNSYFRYKKIDEIKNEQWLPLNENKYISSTGRIKNTADIEIITGSRHGYKICTIDGKYKYVHRLVAEAFVPNPFSYKIVNHLDNNGLNNNMDNLEWCTPKQNTIHSVEHHKKNDIKPDRIFKIDIDGNLLKGYKTIGDAAKDEGIHQSTMSGRIRRNTVVNGYMFSKENPNIDILQSEENVIEEINENIEIEEIIEEVIDGSEYCANGKEVFKFDTRKEVLIRSYSSVEKASKLEELSRSCLLGRIKSKLCVDGIIYTYENKIPQILGNVNRLVYKLDKNMKVVKVYSSLIEAAEEENISKTTMCRITNNSTKFGNYIFSREKHPNIETIVDNMRLGYQIQKINFDTNEILKIYKNTVEASNSENITPGIVSYRIKHGVIKDNVIFKKVLSEGLNIKI